jgi:membrane-associated phospholipid phosphatase
MAAGVSVLLVAVLALRFHDDGSAHGLDLWAAGVTATLWPHPGTSALIIDAAGSPVVAAALGILLAACCLLAGRRRLALLAVAGPGLAVVTTAVLKQVVQRTIHGANLSYPSGHTAVATALALVLGLLLVDVLRLRRLPALVLLGLITTAVGAVMAVTQIALSAHYPTDTLGGFLSSVATVPVSAFLVDRIAGW